MKQKELSVVLFIATTITYSLKECFFFCFMFDKVCQRLAFFIRFNNSLYNYVNHNYYFIILFFIKKININIYIIQFNLNNKTINFFFPFQQKSELKKKKNKFGTININKKNYSKQRIGSNQIKESLTHKLN